MFSNAPGPGFSYNMYLPVCLVYIAFAMNDTV